MDTREYAKRSLITTAIVFGVAALVYVTYLIRGPLLWIAIAAFVAIAINPAVHLIRRHIPGQNLVLATLIFLVVAGLVGIGMVALFLGPLISQVGGLLGDLPKFANDTLTKFAGSEAAKSLNLTQSGITSYVQSNLSNVINQASLVGTTLVNIIVKIIDNIIALVAIVTLVFFMTLEASRWKRISLKSLHPRHRDKVLEIGKKVYEIITGYVVGNIFLSIIFGVSSALVLWIMHSPYWLALGLFVGVIDLIPLVGSTIGATIVAIISLLSGQPATALVFAIYTVVYVQLENNVLNPMVYSKSVDVSPLVVLVALLIGGAMAGIVGALVAIPVAASLQVITRELLKKRLAS
jgi:predicted PurR-regulated permease PerM